jgi:hypothetical protein
VTRGALEIVTMGVPTFNGVTFSSCLCSETSAVQRSAEKQGNQRSEDPTHRKTGGDIPASVSGDENMARTTVYVSI